MTSDPDDPTPGTDPRLELEYPCEWRYRVIGADAARLRGAIAEAVGDDEHEIREGNTSRTGRYVSLDLVVTVVDDEHRTRILAALGAHAEVRYVL